MVDLNQVNNGQNQQIDCLENCVFESQIPNSLHLANSATEENGEQVQTGFATAISTGFDSNLNSNLTIVGQDGYEIVPCYATQSQDG